MTETPARKRSMVIFSRYAAAASAFSPLTMMKSNPYFSLVSEPGRSRPCVRLTDDIAKKKDR